jgi:putative ATP-dependent endonuclease of OLD family
MLISLWRSFLQRLRTPILPRNDFHGRTDRRRPQLLVIVEGRHDIAFLCRIADILRLSHPDVPDLRQRETSGQLIFIPAGGNDFRPWQARLAPFGCAEFHLYDRDIPAEASRRLSWAERVNQRSDCRAFVTQKRSLENYLHPAAIQAAHGLTIHFDDFDDVPTLTAQARWSQTHGIPWEHLSQRGRRRMRERVKGILNTTAVEQRSRQLLVEREGLQEILLWLKTILELLRKKS